MAFSIISISSAFGWRLHPTLKEWKFHNGLDLQLPQGTPLHPIAPGRVVSVWHNHAVNGNAVTLDHGGGFQSSYVHLSRIDVTKGQVVNRYTLLGLSGGEPGTAGAGRSTGPHLHLMLSINGKPVDPAGYINWGVPLRWWHKADQTWRDYPPPKLTPPAGD